MKSEDENVMHAEVIAEAAPATVEVDAAELEEFRQFQAFQRMKQQQQQQQQQPAYPARPVHVAPPVGGHAAQVIMPGDTAAAPWMTTCYPCSSCCSRKCSLIACAVIEGVFMLLTLISVGVGWVPLGFVSFFSMIPSMWVLFVHFFATGMAGTNAGCYAYCCTRSGEGGCFHDRRPEARRAFGLMVASMVLGVIAFFLTASTAVCLTGERMWIYCGVASLFVLTSTILGFASSICFTKEVSTYPIACGPIVVQHVPANIQMTNLDHSTVVVSGVQ